MPDRRGGNCLGNPRNPVGQDEISRAHVIETRLSKTTIIRATLDPWQGFLDRDSLPQVPRVVKSINFPQEDFDCLDLFITDFADGMA